MRVVTEKNRIFKLNTLMVLYFSYFVLLIKSRYHFNYEDNWWD